MENVITREISESGDPSKKQQHFKNLNITILCCRYWWFEVWKGQKMAFPYWRLYWNKNRGAYVFFEKTVPLGPENLYLIPPFTPFSNGIQHQELEGNPDYYFKCGEITSEQEEQRHERKGDILHFFTHFTMGYSYGTVKPGIYTLPLTAELRTSLSRILRSQFTDQVDFSMATSLDINRLVISSLSRLPKDIWSPKTTDSRILELLDYMHRNLDGKMTCETLAKRLFMTPSAFSRLFQKNTNKTPSKYLKALRLDRASNLLLHTHADIDSIAQQCGFVDRYHMTKVFTASFKTSPAAFRKKAGYF